MKNLLNFNFKSIAQNNARWLLTLIAILTIGVGQMWGYKRILFQYQGWFATDQAYIEYADSEDADTWSWRAATSLGDNWWYYDLPDWCNNINFRRKDDGTNLQNYNNISSQIYYIYIDGSNHIQVSAVAFKAGFQGANADRWVKVGANGVETLIEPNGSTYDQNVGTTVNLYLKEFGAWTWKTSSGNVGKMTLVYLLGKDGGTGDITDWHTTYTESLGGGENSKDGYTYQDWKWTGNLDLLSNLTTKAELSSGSYYIKYYFSAFVNRASSGDCFEDLPYDRNRDYFFIHFTIPQPAVTISGRPYAGIESIVTATPKDNTTIYGQTFQYQFEETTDGVSWTVKQAYSSDATYTYTPSSTTNKVRVKMKVNETNEESAYAEQTVYEQYYIYVEDTRNWGQMHMTMKNTDNDTYHLNRPFPGEQLLPCDTIDGKPIYRVILDSYFHRLWLSVGGNSKQTYNDGFPINFDIDNGGGSYTYGIKKVNAGNYYRIATDDNENNCYLTAYPTTLYRIVSYDGATGKTYYSNCISSTESTGTVSFFANPAHASSTVYIQTWSNAGATQNGLNGAWTTTTATNYKSNCAAASATGTVFTATLSNSSLSDVDVYEGDYDIHVFANTENNLAAGVAKGGVGTKFTYFDPNPTIFPNEKFNYYWVDWFTAADISVVATVGNKYNANLSEVVSTDPYAPFGQTTGSGANVRYGYNPSTNYFSRTMIAGSGNEIKIKGARVNPNSAGYNTQSSFSDATAWIYTAAAVVKGKATATVTTSYNGYAQTLTENQQLIGGSLEDNTTTYDVLITYDFKTNRLLAAWEPGLAIDGFNLESNLMIVRTEDNAPTVLNIVDNNSDGITALSGITKIYMAMELLQSSWLDGEKYGSRRIDDGANWCDEYYWISLPYECKVSDIFGIDNYGSEGSWVIQTYRGDLRAEKGWWAETSAWWYDLDKTDTLKANVGYVLRVTNLNGDHGTTRKFASDSGTNKLYLYFPSDNISELTIDLLGATTTTHLDSLKCTVWRKKPNDEKQGEHDPIWDRRAVDSNWRVIGSPSFNSTVISAPAFITSTADKNGDGYISLAEQKEAVEAYIAANSGATPYSLKYYYNWTVVGGTPKFTIANAATTEFKATHAHLVQYAGDITWAPYDPSSLGSNPLVGLSAAPARKNTTEQVGEQTLRLVLMNDNSEADVAYVSRMLYGATEGYDVNMDLSKMINANSANLYTYGELYKMAGNCLPDSVTTVQVGVQLAAAGDYTFTMPDGTNGTGVVLVDNVADTRTNLALTDYSVHLEAGETNERFRLELSPIAQTPTDVEQVSCDQTAALRKVMVDGVLYIVKDSKVFDARGNRVR